MYWACHKRGRGQIGHHASHHGRFSAQTGQDPTPVPDQQTSRRGRAVAGAMARAAGVSILRAYTARNMPCSQCDACFPLFKCEMAFRFRESLSHVSPRHQPAASPAISNSATVEETLRT